MPEGHLCFFKLGLYISNIHSTSTVNNLEFYIKFVYSTIYIYRTWDNAFAYTWNCNFEIKSICKTPISILLSISRFYRLHSSRPCHCHTLLRWITYSPERLGVGCLLVCCLYFVTFSSPGGEQYKELLATGHGHLNYIQRPIYRIRHLICM